MASKRPRVLGLEELLDLRKPLRERPAPLVYFSDAEFSRLVEGAVELKRMPRAAMPLARFEPWPGGGIVQQRCESPPGQICVGRWTPAGPGHGSGVFFDCVCQPVGEPPPLKRPCRLLLDAKPSFRCDGDCDAGGTCRLARFRDPKTGATVLDCACRAVLSPA
jgi:hypothetical protein